MRLHGARVEVAQAEALQRHRAADGDVRLPVLEHAVQLHVQEVNLQRGRARQAQACSAVAASGAVRLHLSCPPCRAQTPDRRTDMPWLLWMDSAYASLRGTCMRHATSLSPIWTVHSALASTLRVTHSLPAVRPIHQAARRELCSANIAGSGVHPSQPGAPRLTDEEFDRNERGRIVAAAPAARLNRQHLAPRAIDEAAPDVEVFEQHDLQCEKHRAATSTRVTMQHAGLMQPSLVPT